MEKTMSAKSTIRIVAKYRRTIVRINDLGVYISWIKYAGPKFLLFLALLSRRNPQNHWPPKGFRAINTKQYNKHGRTK